MHVIGTAGHVDHGKSALITALSGMHPDRLKEEIAREMSIDLGFAWFDLPNGETVGVVDVPGHRDFIENMLAGVGGIDAVLFVIAADEGIMPQTREHLAILDLLQIQTSVIALNKVDLIHDPEWLDMIKLDIKEAIKGTVLEKAPIIGVSAKTKQGLNELKIALQVVLDGKVGRSDLGRPRLPIDRVFHLSGFGTIVTGTLLDGVFHLGDDILILPSRLKGRIRGLQTHKQKEESAYPGSRTAINISGINKKEIKRGDVVILPGSYQPTRLLDLHFRLLAGIKSSIKHNTEVKLFLGAAEVQAQLRLLGCNELEPGNEALIQLKLIKPVVAVRGDRYILRRPSPSETLGGGVVLDPHPEKIHKRFNKQTLKALNEMLKGDPKGILLQITERLSAPTIEELLQKAALSPDEGRQIINTLLNKGLLISLSADTSQSVSHKRIMTQASWLRETERVISLLTDFHQEFPLREDMQREALRAKLDMNSEIFELVVNKLARESKLKLSGTSISMASHKITLSKEQEAEVKSFFQKFNAAPYNPPSFKESQELLGEELLTALILTGRLIRVSDDIIFTPDAYRQMIAMVKKRLYQNGSISLTQLRDHFQTSRRFALALLEHLDIIGMTLRQGDLRILKKNSQGN